MSICQTVFRRITSDGNSTTVSGANVLTHATHIDIIIDRSDAKGRILRFDYPAQEKLAGQVMAAIDAAFYAGRDMGASIVKDRLTAWAEDICNLQEQQD